MYDAQTSYVSDTCSCGGKQTYTPVCSLKAIYTWFKSVINRATASLSLLNTSGSVAMDRYQWLSNVCMPLYTYIHCFSHTNCVNQQGQQEWHDYLRNYHWFACWLSKDHFGCCTSSRVTLVVHVDLHNLCVRSSECKYIMACICWIITDICP